MNSAQASAFFSPVSFMSTSGSVSAPSAIPTSAVACPESQSSREPPFTHVVIAETSNGFNIPSADIPITPT